MNRTKGYLLRSTALALLAACQLACADDEALFGALRSKVSELRPHESAEVLARMENALSHITPCPSDTPEPAWGSRAGIGLDGVDYLYGNPATSADETSYCFFLVKPLHRALTVDEARDFSDAMMMPDIQHFAGGKSTAAERIEGEDLGEKHFAEIRTLVASKKSKVLYSESAGRIDRSLKNLDRLEDCSSTSIDELERRSWKENAGSNDNQGLYNDNYYWRDLDPSGSRCIYMLAPFHRGLTAEEAKDFLTALQLDFGYSDEYKRAMSDDSATGHDDQSPLSTDGDEEVKKKQAALTLSQASGR